MHDAVHFHALLRAQQVGDVLGDLARDELAGHQHRNAGRVGNDLVGADAPGKPAIHPLALVEHRQELAAAVVRVARQESQLGEGRDLRRLHQPPRRAVLARDAHQRVVEARYFRAGRTDGQEQGQRVEGRFLGLDVVALEQHFLQVVDRVAAAGNVDRHLGRIEADAVVLHLLRHQVLELEDAEHFRRIDQAPHLVRQLQGAREQLEALHHRLLARHVEAGDQPVLRAGRGMHVEVLAKEMLAEAGIVDVDHRGLRKGREHLVRRLGGVVGAGFQRGRTELGMEAGEAVPGFVDDHLDAARVRRRDDRREIVAQAVIGAGGEDQRLRIGVFLDFS